MNGDTQGVYAAGWRCWTIVLSLPISREALMDNAVNAFIVAQYTQDRLTEARSARRAGEAKTKREPKLRHARRWLTRRPPAVAPTSEPSRTITGLPPV